jgi:hypothetical protein
MISSRYLSLNMMVESEFEFVLVAGRGAGLLRIAGWWIASERAFPPVTTGAGWTPADGTLSQRQPAPHFRPADHEPMNTEDTNGVTG